VTTPAPPRDLRRLVRRRVLQTLAVVFFIMLAGMTYQGVASAFERARLPHPGQLIDVGGHQLHIHCTGDGAPTVVLEADAGMPSVAWSAVQPTLSAATRTCSYDRTGLGWSETGDRRFEVTRVAEELRTLLANAGERPPFVLVGTRAGAAFVTIFAGTYPQDVAALVLIDRAVVQRPTRRITSAAPWLARIGVRRLMGDGDRAAAGLPPQAGDAVRTFLYRPDHLSRTALEFAHEDEAMQQAAATPATAPRIEAPDEPAAIVDAIRRAIRSVRAPAP
jgi:pimeloyl-ACP methyl ester carboxylesterase